jgi:hypothetical protein
MRSSMTGRSRSQGAAPNHDCRSSPRRETSTHMLSETEGVGARTAPVAMHALETRSISTGSSGPEVRACKTRMQHRGHNQARRQEPKCLSAKSLDAKPQDPRNSRNSGALRRNGWHAHPSERNKLLSCLGNVVRPRRLSTRSSRSEVHPRPRWNSETYPRWATRKHAWSTRSRQPEASAEPASASLRGVACPRLIRVGPSRRSIAQSTRRPRISPKPSAPSGGSSA